MKPPLFRDSDSIKALAERLSACREVTKYDTKDEKEAWTLAHSFADLEESFHKLLEDQFPKLARGNLDESEIRELLLEIGEEFRHVLYHIRDPRFFRYVSADDASSDTS